MKDLIGISIRKVKGVDWMTGYVLRGQTRKRVWSVPLTGRTKEDIFSAVQAEEDARALAEEG